MEALPDRRRDAVRTRAAILSAAQSEFSGKGYPATSIRDIAALAGVAASLVMRYFESKPALFEAALLHTIAQSDPALGERDALGARLAQATESADISLPAMMVLSSGDEQAREITARITRSDVIAPLATLLGGANAESRAERIIMLCTGYVIYARQLPVGRVDSARRDWLARSIQALVDGD